MSFVCVLALLLSLTASAAPAVVNEPIPGSTYGVVAEIESGHILGRNEDGIYIFKGIKYAEAERWQMPTKVEPWDGLMNCQYVGPVSPQTGGSGEFASNPAYYLIDSSEKNMLNLNVWTPTMDPDAKLPVIFWIHGGGYANGSSVELLQYDGKNLAAYGNIVFVSVNHRLNYLGYLDFSAYGEEYKYSGNVGHADLVMALEWVRDNITIFGGDPNNVTIEGQSGGSTKVCQLMAMPAAKGLFHKVVAQSSGSFSFTTTQERAQASTAALVEYLGLTDKSNEEIMATLTALPYDELVAACQAARVSAGAVCDNDYVLADISYSAGEIPLMVGSVSCEFSANLNGMGITGSYRNGSIMKSLENYYYNDRTYVTDEEVVARYEEKYGDNAQAIMDAFQKAYPGQDLFHGLYLANRSNNVAASYANVGGTAYQYVVSYVFPMFGGIEAYHTGGDIAFFFRNNDKVHAWVAGDEENADKVSATMATALVNFAYTGDPSQEGLDWAPFSIENGETMIFDVSSEVRNYHDKELMELMSQR